MGPWLVKGVTTLIWLLFVLPLIWMVLTSLKTPGDIFRLPVSILPADGWRWANYREVWHRLAIGRMLGNSLLVTGLVVVGQLATGAVSGYVFARVRSCGGRALFGLYLLSLVVPGQLTLIPSFALLSRMSLIDTRAALVLPFIAGAQGAFIMRGQFRTISRELEEAAWLDGCTSWSLARYVLLPAVSPGLRAVAALTFLFSWNDLLWPLLMTHRAEIRTLPVGLAFLHDEISAEWHLLMAGSVIAAVPALIIIGLLTRGLQLPGFQALGNDREA